VLVRTTEDGRRLATSRIINSPAELRNAIGAAGTEPRVVLEATYGWHWAADVLAEAGAEVHLAHPLGVAAYSARRVKTTSAARPTWLICCGWAGCPRRGSRRRSTGSYAS
jgi:transposase